MKEIKFRVYDTVRKEWLHKTEHAVNLFGENILCGGFLRRNDWSHVKLEELNDLVAMQYTGLKDSKGVDIFEGDIVLASGNNLRYVVEFGKYSDREDVEFHQGFYIKRIENWIGYKEGCGNSHIYLTIIGNIYDNPELLQNVSKNNQNNV